MKAFIAFTKKELTAQLRTGKLIILGILFLLFGIMNPAVAKLTPWMMELFAESLEQTGITISAITVTAMDSWVQFFKNIPMALIAFVLLQGSIYTGEYQTGTLILSLTKGLQRYKVIFSKALVLTLLWSAGYWLCFGVTFSYNTYFWDNSIAKNLLFSALCWWLFGVWVVSMMTLFSTLSNANTGVLLSVGSVILLCSLLGLIPPVQKYLPTMLTDGNSLIYGLEETSAYLPALLITIFSSLLCFIISIPIFNKKNL